MKVMIMASGRGSRLRPITDQLPKPLIPIAGKPLLHWHLMKLARSGFREVVINTGWLGDMIEDYCGDGSAWGMKIHYVQESREEGHQLEVGGGIVSALAYLGYAPFLVINADIWTDWPYCQALLWLLERGQSQGRLLLTKDSADPLRPGDFDYEAGQFLWKSDGVRQYVFAGISLLSPDFFDGYHAGQVYFLFDILKPWMAQDACDAEIYTGFWVDMGTKTSLDFLSAAVLSEDLL